MSLVQQQARHGKKGQGQNSRLYREVKKKAIAFHFQLFIFLVLAEYMYAGQGT